MGSRRNRRGRGGGGGREKGNKVTVAAVVVGVTFSQHLKLRQKCGRATVSKSVGQLISATIPNDIPNTVCVCVHVYNCKSKMNDILLQ